MPTAVAHRVALGFGNNVDYEIVWDSDLIEYLCRQHCISGNDIHEYTVINNVRELLGSILFHLKTGSGKEVLVSDSGIIEEFSACFQKKITMGGTGIRAAIAMAKMGVPSALHLVTINDLVRRGIPKGCSFVCSSDQDRSYPHLIVQYKAGIKVCTAGIEICSQTANRIIYTHDRDNAEMRINEDYASLIQSARILLVSGFNVMLDYRTMDHRLEAVRHLISVLPEGAVVFSEFGCYLNEELQWHFLTQMRDRIDIFSMNEEEMQQLLARKVNLMDAYDVSEALKSLHGMIGTEYLLVHTHLWAAIYGSCAEKYADALRSAVALATTRYRFGDDFTAKEYDSSISLPILGERREFAAGLKTLLGEGILIVPVGEARETNVTTIGLGDSFVGGFMLPFAKDI